MSDLFYVYELVNSLNGEVFYIGKGKGCRAEMHVPAALRGVNFYVHRKIRKILALGGEIKIQRILETPDELEAFNEEIRLIKKYGRENLTNLTDGGEGSAGFRHSAESIAKRKRPAMNCRLNITVDAELIDAAKKYATRHFSSVSQLIRDYLAEIKILEDEEKDKNGKNRIIFNRGATGKITPRPSESKR